MTGVQHVKIYTEEIMYEFDLYRNITIIRGNSATGKTALYRLVADYGEAKRLGQKSAVTIECDKECIAFNGDFTSRKVTEARDSIIFIDEGYIGRNENHELANLIKGSDNYFVLITRSDITELPYSITEIYRIKPSNKYNSVYRVYNQLDRIYKADTETEVGIKKNVVITEDSGAGNEAFKRVLSNCMVESANGKSNMINILDEHSSEQVAMVVDGAAFGPEMQSTLRRLKQFKGRAVLYAPESFEWILLNLKMFRSIKEKIQNTSDYADSSEYMSWEQYYTDLLKEELQKKGIVYNKNRMPRQLLSESTLRQIKEILPDIFE